MKLSYDEATDSLYIHLTDRVAVDSHEISSGMVLDFDGDGALVGTDLQHASPRIDHDGTLKIRLSEKPIASETSPNRHTNISYADDNAIVEIVLLDAIKRGQAQISRFPSFDQPQCPTPHERTVAAKLDNKTTLMEPATWHKLQKLNQVG